MYKLWNILRTPAKNHIFLEHIDLLNYTDRQASLRTYVNSIAPTKSRKKHEK